MLRARSRPSTYVGPGRLAVVIAGLDRSPRSRGPGPGHPALGAAGLRVGPSGVRCRPFHIFELQVGEGEVEKSDPTYSQLWSPASSGCMRLSADSGRPSRRSRSARSTRVALSVASIRIDLDRSSEDSRCDRASSHLPSQIRHLATIPVRRTISADRPVGGGSLQSTAEQVTAAPHQSPCTNSTPARMTVCMAATTSSPVDSAPCSMR